MLVTASFSAGTPPYFPLRLSLTDCLHNDLQQVHSGLSNWFFSIILELNITAKNRFEGLSLKEVTATVSNLKKSYCSSKPRLKRRFLMRIVGVSAGLLEMQLQTISWLLLGI